ncbi:MAG: polynucleotide adenylyltransferase/metal dependent phosphohydrolase [Chloroflexi bacterium]|nr:polynucleotide adenylyltransferase/metal dependent phosphohydrolase [Chloroflexota bacterium]MDB5074816.1 polynucleotide adenylyltransferase/metal dependent phosphohydrolase [Chloroflexota bacterium]
MPTESPNSALSPRALAALATAFARHGKSIYLVGGIVRDRLLGRESADYDFTTDAEPEETKRILRAVSDNVFQPGERYGTISATIEGHDVQITTFRGDKYAPGSRKPEVWYGVSLEEDLARRDFTINAMALRLDESGETFEAGPHSAELRGRLADPFHGQEDLEHRVIRAVGEPAERFAEDPLRLLRAVRQATQLEFTIDPGTAEAITAGAQGLATISGERIGQEMEKLLLAARPSYGIRLLVDLGLISYIIPELLPMVEMQRRPGRRHKDVFAHVMQVLDKTPPSRELRWAGLLHDIAKPATMRIINGEVHFFGHEVLGARIAKEVLTRLKYDHALIESVTSLVGQHMRINTYSDWTDGAVRRFMRDAGPQLENLFALSRADITSHRFERVRAVLQTVDALEARCRQLEEQAEIAKMHSPLDGVALMALTGRPPGRWIARVKDFLLDLVLDGELDMDDVATGEALARAFLAIRYGWPPAEGTA